MDVRKPELGQPLTTDQGADSLQKAGKLTIFFGMAPGVGKTFAMLKEAREEAQIGRDVVIGFLRTHNSKRTEALIQGLKLIPGCLEAAHTNSAGKLDLDAILSRQPHLVVIDELAHTNPPGSRHPHRYQDVRELLLAGIDVFTTLNLHNIASESEAVRRFTGFNGRESVPDSVFDRAEIRLVDLSPAKLLQRLHVQMSYLTQDAELSSLNFFNESNLVALREMSWRFVADHMGCETRVYMQHRQIEGPWKSGPRLLAVVCPGASPEQVVSWTRRQAEALNSPWLALYVETPRDLAGSANAQITRALALAQELGAEVITTTDHDLVKGVLRVAKQRNATRIIIGNSGKLSGRAFSRGSLMDKLVTAGGDFEVLAVPTRLEVSEKSGRTSTRAVPSSLGQYVVAAGLIGAITIVSFIWGPIIGGPYAAALIYLLAVVILGSFVRRGPTLMAATLSALLWDYFILPPIFKFQIANAEDVLLLGTYFVVALTLGQLTTRIRAQQRAERLGEERATALYLLTRELNEASTLDQIAQQAVEHMERAFNAQAMLFSIESPGQLQQLPSSAGEVALGAEEKEAIDWVVKHGEKAGRHTPNMPLTKVLFAPLRTAGSVIGVMGLRLTQSFPPTIHQLNLLDSFLHQIAFAMDRHRLREFFARAKLLAESERLSKALLNSMSHEMRTPIAVINSAANNLGELLGENDAELCRETLGAIQHASERLNRLVGNILDVARLESGRIQPRISECDVSELVHFAVNSAEKQLGQHKVTVEIEENLPLVPMDFGLTEQAVTNLLSNAAFHTPPETAVNVRVRAEREFLIIEVADRGPGIPEEALDRLFQKFYRAPGAPTGGTGLGLSLAKGFVEAQGGTIEAKNRPGGGAIFTIHLPLGNPPRPALEKTYEQPVE